MSGKKPERCSAHEERSRCQIGCVPGRPSCAEFAKMHVDGLVLCERHALEARLEGQISCWDGMLFHIELWSREASRQDRSDIVELLEVERVKATSAIERARSDLDLARGHSPSGNEVLLKKGFHPHLPRGARLLSRELRRRARR